MLYPMTQFNYVTQQSDDGDVSEEEEKPQPKTVKAKANTAVAVSKQAQEGQVIQIVYFLHNESCQF